MSAQLLTEEEFQRRLKEVKGTRFRLLSRGGITLVSATGGDREIIEAARTTSDITGRGDADDWNLIRFLMRHRHSTPSEFPDVKWLIECPMDLWRQAIRYNSN